MGLASEVPAEPEQRPGAEVPTPSPGPQPDPAHDAGTADAVEELLDVDRRRRRFVAMISHEIRNPASVVSGFLDHVVDHGEELSEERVEDLLRRASENARRVNRLVDDLVTVTDVESEGFSFALRPVVMLDVLQRVVEQMRHTTGRDIDLLCVETCRPALVDTDRQAQILTNLISNAAKYSPPETPIRVTLQDHGDQVISVRDEGPGLSEQEQREIFRPFARLEHDPQRHITGDGLGLYITRMLVEGQGGSIWVESTRGHGSTFSYNVLPARQAPDRGSRR
jgi:signal transduction histidine kinase